MVSRHIHLRDWLVVLVVQLCLVRSSADYVWDGTEWIWQEDTAADSDGVEGSAGGNYHSYPDHTDDDDVEGSGPDDFEKENKKDYSYTDSINNKEVINVDDEIDPREVDIGFHEESSSSISLPDPVKPTQSAESTPSSDPDKQSQETNFFAQPGILAAVIGGTVVGLLCTILLVMLIVYRMRKADEGSYSLNEPKRSPNVHSYLKAPSREFFA